MKGLGWMLIVAGGTVALFGLLFLLGDRIPFLGRLPGDIHVERDGLSIHFPIVTCLVIGVVVTVLLNALLFLLRR